MTTEKNYNVIVERTYATSMSVSSTSEADAIRKMNDPKYRESSDFYAVELEQCCVVSDIVTEVNTVL